MKRGATRTLGYAIAPWIVLAAGSGCGSTRTTGTARSGTEQLLLTNAWDDALRKVDFRPLAGVPVFLDAANVTAVDQGWVISSLRQAMLSQGVLLKPKVEQAQWVVEARVGAYGTDEYNYLIGVQQTNVPAVVPGIPGGTIPEIPLVKKSDQHAVAKMALFAYDRASGQMVWNSGTMLSTSSAKDVYVGGIGPIQSGTIRKRNKRIGVNIPMVSDPETLTAPGMSGTATGTSGRPGNTGTSPAPNFTPPPMGLPASASDLQSFAPEP